MQPEAAFKRRIVASYKRHVGAWHTYLTPTGGQKSGMPDLMFLRPYFRPLWVEAKIDDEPLSAQQRRVCDLLVDSGETVVIARRSETFAYLQVYGEENMVNRLVGLDASFWQFCYMKVPPCPSRATNS